LGPSIVEQIQQWEKMRRQISCSNEREKNLSHGFGRYILAFLKYTHPTIGRILDRCHPSFSQPKEEAQSHGIGIILSGFDSPDIALLKRALVHFPQ
jgi:hypothetical protein